MKNNLGLRSKLNYFTQTDPINYDYAAQDNMKHLYFRDYKELKGVQFTDTNVIWSDVFGAIMLIVAMLAISTVLFLN